MTTSIKLGLAAAILGILVAAVALSIAPRHADAAPAKNLEVLPKGMDKKEVKKIMKVWTKSLGVECDYCHDMDDMTADSKHKDVARKMYKMQTYINAKYMKAYKTEVTCMTCHQGAEKP